MIGTLLGQVQSQAQAGAHFWMPVSASTFSKEVDWVFYFILGICTFFFVLIVTLMVLFAVKFRARKERPIGSGLKSSLTLELTWTIIPTIIVVIIFYYGFKGYMDMATPPANSYPIIVTAQKWQWLFQYPNGHVDEQLHVPAQRPISLVLQSNDVIHSLYIPAFRIKRDAVPGRYNKTWFEATQMPEPGETLQYDLFCAEYCGTGHSTMLSKVIVHEPTAFNAWLEDASNWVDRMSPADAGKALYERRGCTQCHSVDGTAGTGPSFKNLWGYKQNFKDGTSTVADENYIRDSILNPLSKIVDGYEGVMPTYRGSLKDNEITAIIEYMKTLSDKYEPPTVTAESQPATTAPSGEQQRGAAGDATTQPSGRSGE